MCPSILAANYLSVFQTRLVNNQLYDETLSVHDDEEIASTITPSPRPAKSRGLNQSGMVCQSKPLSFSAFTFEMSYTFTFISLQYYLSL